MLDLEAIKERLAWVDEEGLNGYTWDIKDTHRQYRDLVAEVERLRDALEDIADAPRRLHYSLSCEERARQALAPAPPAQKGEPTNGL